MLRILLSLILLFLPFCSYAAEQQPRFDIIADFSGGLNSHISDLNTPNNQAVEALNVRTNDRYSALSKREPLLLSWAAVSGGGDDENYGFSDVSLASIADSVMKATTPLAGSAGAVRDGNTTEPQSAAVNFIIWY